MMKVGMWFLAVILVGCVAGPQISDEDGRSSDPGAVLSVAVDDTSAEAEESAGGEEAASPAEVRVQEVFRLVKEYRYFRDGTLEKYTDYSYDSSGSLVKEERYGEDDELLETVEYHYDEHHVTEKKTISGAGELKSIHRYAYTTDGLLESDSLYDADDTVQITSRYAYDDRGVKARWEIFDSTGSRMARTDYLYEEGRLIRIEIYTGDGSLSDYSTIEYNQQGGKIKESFYTVPKNLEKTMLFEYTGELVDTQSSFDAKDNLIGKTMYQHDEDGNLINTIFLDGEENVREIVEREYAFLEIG